MITDNLDDEAAHDFERLLRINSKKSKVEWNRAVAKFNDELLLFQTVENQVYQGGFQAHEHILPMRTNFEDEEMLEEPHAVSNSLENDLMRDSSTQLWNSYPAKGLLDTEKRFNDYLHQEEEDAEFIPEESCMQIIPQEQLNSNLQLIDQSFAVHDGNMMLDSNILESVSESNAKSCSAVDEQILIQKYFKELNITKDSKLNQQKLEFDTKIRDLEATISDLTRELSKARQQTNKFRRERDEWERKETTLKKEKDHQYEWMTNEMTKLKEEHMKEMKKLRKEKKDWETQRKLAEMLPTKREREELEILKNQFQEQYAKWKERDSRMILAQDRLKKKIIELEKRNNELSEEVKILEAERTAQKQLQLKFKNNIHPVSYPEKKEIASHTNKIASKSLSMEPLQTQKNEEILPMIEQKNVTIADTQRTLKKASREKVSLVPPQKYSSLSDEGNEEVQIEAKKMTEFDPAKTDLDQLQRELGLGRPLKSQLLEDGTRERNYSDGSKILWCLDGTMRYFSYDNISVVYYSNGDSKTTYPDKRKVYWYNRPKTKHTTYPDGIQVCEFEDGQMEKRYPDNTLIVEFPDKTIKTITPDGMEKIQYPDGVVQEITENGARIYTTYPDGIIELVTEEMVSKLYKSGIIKITFPDGTEETRWPNGQIRIKDPRGRVQMS